MKRSAVVCLWQAGLAELLKARGVICAVESSEPGSCRVRRYRRSVVVASLGFRSLCTDCRQLFLTKARQNQVKAACFLATKVLNRPARPSQTKPSEERSKQAKSIEKLMTGSEERGLEEFK